MKKAVYCYTAFNIVTSNKCLLNLAIVLNYRFLCQVILFSLVVFTLVLCLFFFYCSDDIAGSSHVLHFAINNIVDFALAGKFFFARTKCYQSYQD